jgi:hypothetical protein
MKRATLWLFAPEVFDQNSRPAKRNTSIGGLSFAVEIEGENIPMRISEAALRQVFGADRSQSTWLATYRENAEIIDARAVELHLADPSKPVFLEAADFRNVPA